jgi:hypothetical protein
MKTNEVIIFSLYMSPLDGICLFTIFKSVISCPGKYLPKMGEVIGQIWIAPNEEHRVAMWGVRGEYHGLACSSEG